MFIAVYEFEIPAGTEARFREAWLEVQKVPLPVWWQPGIPPAAL